MSPRGATRANYTSSSGAKEGADSSSSASVSAFRSSISGLTGSPALSTKGLTASPLSMPATALEAGALFNLDALPIPPPPLSILLFRTPVPSSEATDPYHDAFGSFCLPSFPVSALESGSTTPLPPPINPATLTGPSDRSGAEMLKSALNLSTSGRRRGRWIADEPTLTTHHLASKDESEMQVLEKLTQRMGGSMATTSALMDDHVEYCVTSIPILTSRSVNLEGLVERMINGATVDLPQFQEDEEEVTPRGKFKQQMKYRGVVVTSQKAAEAWEAASMMAAQRLVQEASDRGDLHTTPPFTPWPRIPFFAVGPATSAALKNTASKVPAPFRPRLVLGGAATGTGEALSNYLIKHFGSGGPGSRPAGWTSSTGSPLNPPKRLNGVNEAENYRGPAPIEPLLILTGDKNLPTIPDMLGAVGRPRKGSKGGDDEIREGLTAGAPSLNVNTAAQTIAQPDGKSIKRTFTPPRPPELHEMAPIPFELLQIYETAEDPAFEDHIRSFEQTLPPVSSRPSSRRPSGSSGSGEADVHTSYAAATGMTALASPVPGVSSAPHPTLLSAAIAGAAREQESSPSSSAEASVPSSASVSRRSSLKAMILAERLNAVNKAAAASGLPSPLMPATPSGAGEAVSSIPSPGVTSLPQSAASPVQTAPSPGATAHATAAFLQAASQRTAGGADALHDSLNQAFAQSEGPFQTQGADPPRSQTDPGTRSAPASASANLTAASAPHNNLSLPSGSLSGRPLNPVTSGVLISSPLATDLNPTPASGLPDDSNGGSGSGSGSSSSGSGSMTALTPSGGVGAAPGIFRASGSAPSQAHESTLGTLDEDSAVTDEALLEKAINARQAKQKNAHKPDWLVFFSPSGVQYALPHLRRRRWLPPEPPADSIPPPIDAKPGAGGKYPKVAVLGPTTKRWIKENLHFLPDAVAATPSPIELKEAITLIEKRRRIETMKKKLEKAEEKGEATT